jgi:hypothetical protein
MNNFVKDFDRYYLMEILQTPLKNALVNLTGKGEKIKKNELKDVIIDGEFNSKTYLIPESTTNGIFNQSLRTLTFNIDHVNFKYDIKDIDQKRYDTIVFNFLVNYSFFMFNTNWSKHNKPVDIEIDVYGLKHPDYSRIIEKDWIENNTEPCLIDKIMDVNVCIGKDIMPP